MLNFLAFKLPMFLSAALMPMWVPALLNAAGLSTLTGIPLFFALYAMFLLQFTFQLSLHLPWRRGRQILARTPRIYGENLKCIVGVLCIALCSYLLSIPMISFTSIAFFASGLNIGLILMLHSLMKPI